MEVFTLVERKKNPLMLFAAWLSALMSVICFVLLCLGVFLAFIAGVVFALASYLAFSSQNTEYEYSYFDGELRFARIKNKSKRKALATYEMNTVSVIAPLNDSSVRQYENAAGMKTLDYTSKNSDVPCYVIVVKTSDDNLMIKAELEDRFLEEIEKKYRSKVKR